jgi:hypothetical protein
VLPDTRGLNLFHADPGYAGLLKLYLDPELYVHLAPHFERLGALAGGELDALAATAHQHRLRALDPLERSQGEFEESCADALLSESPLPPERAERILETYRA